MKIITLIFGFLLLANSATAAECDFTHLINASPFLQSGFIEASDRILSNEREAEKARAVFPYVKRIFLEPRQRLIAMYGWDESPPFAHNAVSLAEFIATEKDRAVAQGIAWDSKITQEPLAAYYTADYIKSGQGQRDMGIYVAVNEECLLAAKISGPAAGGVALWNDFQNELNRLQRQAASAPVKEKWYKKLLPSFSPSIETPAESQKLNKKHLFKLLAPTLLLALLFLLLFVKRYQLHASKFTSVYLYVALAGWLLYLAALIWRPEFLHLAAPVALENYIYAIMFVTAHLIVLLIRPLLLLATALNMGHALRGLILLTTTAPMTARAPLFDVILIGFLTIALLFTSAERRPPKGAKSRYKLPNVVERK